ncbi:MAG: hypothetical protein CME01_12575 [Geminicoccus sp.]|jgi:hypothetical protein|nr:hypothetical protein [Geminicoccus sp.]
MRTIFLILTLVFLVGTLVTMLLGAFSMGRGGTFNEKYGNLLMRARTVCQGGTIVCVLLMFLSSRSGA